MSSVEVHPAVGSPCVYARAGVVCPLGCATPMPSADIRRDQYQTALEKIATSAACPRALYEIAADALSWARKHNVQPTATPSSGSAEDRAWLLDEIRGAREVLAKIQSAAAEGVPPEKFGERMRTIYDDARARKRSLDSVLRVAASFTPPEHT